MIYREIALPVELQRIALCAWQFVVETGDPAAFPHQVPPDGSTALVLIRSPQGAPLARIVGPSLAAFTVPVAKGYHYAGLRLRPEMARLALEDVPMPGMIADAALDGTLAPVWRDVAAAMDGPCAWEETRRCFATVGEGDAAVGSAVDRLLASGGVIPIAHLAALSQLSERQFRRRFYNATGVTPKQYADVQRVRRALILALDDPDWAGIAHESGFADQPHLIRDVKQRFGAAPLRIVGYFGGMRHELLDLPDGRNIQARPANAA
jgi:AraC-like DNA-binding protein